MRFTLASITVAVLFASNALAGIIAIRGDGDEKGDENGDGKNLFKDANLRFEGAICKSEITVKEFPNLVVPSGFRGGCVRYYQGLDMTGVVTEVDIYFPTVKTACDCIAECLSRPLSCTNWVFKHTFSPLDSGRRSCTLYSSPNLPTNVTLVYDLHNATGLGLSTGYQLLRPGNNPQAGGAAPLTFLNANNTIVDPYGVSGFMTQDQNGKQYC